MPTATGWSTTCLNYARNHDVCERAITLRDQPLPRSANGKLLKRNLRDEIIDSTEA